MINRFDVTFIHSPVDENVRKYVTRKLGRLDRFMPKSAQESAHAEIVLRAGKTRDGRDSICDATLHMPRGDISVSEASVNMYTAVDIVELKLRHQIKKYKDMHSGSLRRRLVSRFVR